MFSAMSCSPAEMKILLPVSLYVPSACGSAFVRSRPRSVPHCGSVRHIVPVQCAARELAEVEALLLFGAVRHQAFVGAVRQAGIHRPGLVRRIEHLEQALVDDVRQALATERRVAAQRGPAAFDVLRVGVLEAGRRLHFVRRLVEHAAFGVADRIERQQHLARELAAFLEHGIDRVGVDIGVGRQRLELVDGTEHFVEHELHVPQGRRIGRHGWLLVDVRRGAAPPSGREGARTRSARAPRHRRGAGSGRRDGRRE